MSKTKRKTFRDITTGTPEELEQIYVEQSIEEGRARVKQAREQFEAKQKAKEEQKKVEAMEDASKRKLQQELDKHKWYGETTRHVEIRNRIQGIDYEKGQLYGMDIVSKKKLLEKLDIERKALRQEYASIPYVWEGSAFIIPQRWECTRRDGAKLTITIEANEPKLTCTNSPDRLYKLEKDKEGKYHLVTFFNNDLIFNFIYDLVGTRGMRVDIPISFNPPLESKENTKNITKCANTEKKGILEKVKEKLAKPSIERNAKGSKAVEDLERRRERNKKLS